VPDLGNYWLWVAPAVGFIVHLTVGRQNAARVARQWEELPTALDAHRLGQIRSAVECDSDTLQIAIDSARQACAEKDQREAQRQLVIAHSIVADAIPDRIRRLKALALVTRMAGAVETLPAVTPSSYRSWPLRALAALASALQSLSFGPALRLLVRMRMLRAAFVIVRGLLNGWQAALPRLSAGSRALRQFEVWIEDFRTLDQQHLEAAGACLVASRIQPRIQIVPQRVR
jgi:hypothetical protein